jgi:hypothetical protein
VKRRDFLISPAALAAARHCASGSDAAAAPNDMVPPANRVRGAMRLFVSETEDKSWFYDRDMWPRYLEMLKVNRFTRFQLALGIGYDFLRDVSDAYFLFAYPFLVNVPGSGVRVKQLSDAERERNLETLRFIAQAAAGQGLEFQLGIWMHGYEWENSPRASYTIEGLDHSSHAPYCREALALLLRSCPEIRGVTFRIHGESGVAEGSYEFWRTVFEGVTQAGRTIGIDLHAKGIDQRMIDLAMATGMPVQVSPKFWAEHMGLPYHQAEIREQERPREGHRDSGLMALSTGSRSFTRYGYADLLRAGRKYDVLWRIWPGTQRLLLWADPVFAAAYARAFQFEGSCGVELMEPLSFKGRRGSGLAGGRCAFADPKRQRRWDWEKYADWYRVWGRKLENPDTPVQVAPQLAAASRILPLITTAHLPSAANNNYWPEMYTNQSLTEPARTEYTDTPSPRTFGNTSPLDPQLFSRINDFADELLSGERSAKYSPIEVAGWLDRLAAAAAPPVSPDVAIQAGLGRFFAAKFRAAALYGIHERTGDRAALEAAIGQYRKARDAWAALAAAAKDVYAPDVTFGELPWLRGHWLDRLPAIDADIRLLESRLASALASAKESADPKTRAAIREVLGGSAPPLPAMSHTPPRSFRPKQPLPIQISGPALTSVRLWYRHVNQAERWQSAPMALSGSTWRAGIPEEYTDSPFSLQYYFELRHARGAWLYPGLARDLAGQPYFVVHLA